MFRKGRNQKVLEARLRLVEHVAKPHDQMIQFLMTICSELENKRFHEVAGSISGIVDLCDLQEKSVRMYMSTEVYKMYEIGAMLAYTREEVEIKRDGVFKWLNEVRDLTNNLQDKLRAREIDPLQISDDLDVLVKKICYDRRFRDFTFTLIFLASEFEECRASETEDMPLYLFNTLRLHPIIRKASKKLFKDGHYAPAILEAYKSVNNFVKAKTKQKDLDGLALMSYVFNFQFDDETHQFKRRPLLQLNELASRSDRDEQLGFMYLFMGSMIGIRNPKAHELVLQRDPYRTLEYLALASLLARRIDEATLTS